MKICAISDLHGNLIYNIEESDILIIAGDISPLNIQFNKELMIKWLKKEFIPWSQKLPVNKIFLIAGNHDFVFYLCSEKEKYNLFKDTKIKYLEDSGEIYNKNGKSISIWGTPWCSVFGTWAFMREPEYELSQFNKIPDNIDILISHDPPYGACDICFESLRNVFEHLGNKELQKVIKIRQPKLVFCGHLHTGNHSPEYINNTEIYNVSILNEFYDIAYKPLYITI